MKIKAASELQVYFGSPASSRDGGQAERGWHVNVLYCGEWRTIAGNSRKAFKSKADAELAMHALEMAGLTTAEKIIEAGGGSSFRGRLHACRVMYSALRW